MKQFKHKKVAVLAAIGVLGVGGVMGASAFFTDTAKTVDQVNVGTFNMVLNDYSDLDGNYRTWNADNAANGGVSKLTTNGKQTAKFAEDAVDKDNPSTGIINPGDTGILQFSLKNDQEKSMDTAAVVTVKSSVELTSADAAEYAIEGLGTPTLSKDKMILTYPMVKLATINGSVETEDGAEAADTEVFYAYNADFDRMAKNAFQDATFTVTVDAYAKQHRNSFDEDWQSIGTFEVSTNGGQDTVNK